MPVIEVERLTHRYGKLTALHDINLAIPEGSIFALLGPNGSGKTTLLQILMGLRRATAGHARVLGRDVTHLNAGDKARIGYIAEGQPLPGWMTLAQVEAYLAPLYDSWDHELAAQLRDRFMLDSRRKLRTFSRGEQMKAALLTVLAPRPELLIMDEPFAGMDALVRDELVSGLLESAGTEGWSVLVTSHDLEELEILADGVAFIDRGRLLFADTMEAMHEKFHRVEVQLAADASEIAFTPPSQWLEVQRAGQRISFLQAGAGDIETEVRSELPGVVRIDDRPATLREVFIGLARAGGRGARPVQASRRKAGTVGATP